MAHEVFISYSSKNAEYANAVHDKLENNGIKCWIDSNNIRTATNFAQEIIDGLNEAKVVVLIYSKDSDKSKYVFREIETAFESNKSIVPLKIDDTFPDNLEFFLRNTQWLDASPTTLEEKNMSLESCYDELVGAVKNKIEGGHGVTHFEGNQNVVVPHNLSFFERYGKYIIAVAVILIVVGGFLAYTGMTTQENTEDLNETGVDIGYIGLQDNGDSYSYYVYGKIAQDSNYSSSDVIHIEFNDKNGKTVDSSDSKISEATGNILGSIDTSDDNVDKISLELQDKDKKVLYKGESDNIVTE